MLSSSLLADFTRDMNGMLNYRFSYRSLIFPVYIYFSFECFGLVPYWKDDKGRELLLRCQPRWDASDSPECLTFLLAYKKKGENYTNSLTCNYLKI